MGTAAAITYPRLDAGQKVFRAYALPDHLNRRTNKPVPKIFYRKVNEIGLSVGLSPEGAREARPDAIGCFVLTVGDVRECPDPIDVIQDAETHGEIRGVPTRDEDLEKALRIAKYLVRIADLYPEC